MTTQEITGKSLTYCEIDVDVFRATQFEAVRVGETVENWSQQWDQASHMVGAFDSLFPSGRVAKITHSGANDFSFWRWDVPPSIQDISVLTYQRNTVNDAGSVLALIIRGSGNDGSENGYVLQIAPVLTSVIVAKFQAGTATILATEPIEGADLSVPWWFRFDAINIAGGGVLVRGKVWQGAASDEPELFMISYEDFTSPLTTAGGSGISLSSTASDIIHVGYFRVKSILGSTTETLVHAKPTAFLPATPANEPDIVAVSIQPGELSLGQDLGMRTKVTTQFKDHPSTDLGEFFNNGTHWSKFRSRGLFRRKNAYRLIRKLLDTDTVETRHYSLEEFNGPSLGGIYSLIAQDPIQFADNSRSQCPVMSNGFLSATLAAAGTSFNVLPAGIGAEYSTSGYVAVGGKEAIQFTRVGDAFTVVGGVAGRGLFGTTAIAHAAEDRVQLSKYYDAADAATIVSDQFVNFSNIDSDIIPLVDWLLETDTYLDRLYTRFIGEPTGVNKLVSELCKQAGLIIWHDELANLIRLQVLRGIPTTAFEYNQSNVLAGSMGVQEQLSKRVTQVWNYYGVRNPLAPLDNADNYRSTLVTIDEEGQTEHGEAIIEKVYSTWVPSFGRTTAQRANDLITGRFKTPPRKFSFDVMRYSGVKDPAPGDGARISWWGNQDELGVQHNSPIQITYVDPQEDKFSVRAEEMLFTSVDTQASTDRVITIDSNINNINLRDLHDSIYPVIVPADLGYNGITVTFIISDNIIVGSDTTALRSITVGDWIPNVPLFLRIIGRGQGAGGRGGNGNSGGGEVGQVGGVALYTRYPITLINEGELWGGAGGGGTGMGSVGAAGSFSGGGGAGQVPGAGGVRPGSHSASPGTTEAGGEGFDPGGDGGGPGLVGQTGTGPPPNPQQLGGQPGAAIDGVSFVTIQTVGDIRGPQIN